MTVQEAAKLCVGCGKPATGMCWTDCGMSICGQPTCDDCHHIDEKYGWSHGPRAIAGCGMSEAPEKEQCFGCERNIDHCICKFAGLGEDDVTYRADLPPTPAQIMADPRVQALVDAIDDAIEANPTELNLDNYTHDEVCKLQNEAIDVWKILTAALAQLKKPKP